MSLDRQIPLRYNRSEAYVEITNLIFIINLWAIVHILCQAQSVLGTQDVNVRKEEDPHPLLWKMFFLLY